MPSTVSCRCLAAKIHEAKGRAGSEVLVETISWILIGKDGNRSGEDGGEKMLTSRKGCTPARNSRRRQLFLPTLL